MPEKKKILIVEDEDPIRRALVDKFSIDGHYEILEAEDGIEGLTLALKEHPDIILLDIIMPKMGGMEMLEKLRQDRWGSDVPVMILTNLDSPKSASKALEGGVYDYLYKANWDIEDVANKVNEKFGFKEKESEDK